MAYDLAPLKSYVRFYLNVAEQLTTGWQALVVTHEDARKSLLPYVEPFAPVSCEPLVAATQPAPSAPPALAMLWMPEDPKSLGGLTDVYEVVGRFSFQGEDDDNLARVQQLVHQQRAELDAQRQRLRELLAVPERALHDMGRLEGELRRHATEQREAKLAGLGPLVETLHQRAEQAMTALRSVPMPELIDVDTAVADYQSYATKLDRVYQTCLPFLRDALAALYHYAQCELPPSWPDTLPVHPELPQDLVLVPPEDSPELRRVQDGVKTLQKEQELLGKARDEAEMTLTQLGGELEALAARDEEARVELERAMKLSRFAKALEHIALDRESIVALENQKATRTARLGDILRLHTEREGALAALQEELGARQAEHDATADKLEKERADEPTLFGRDAWRQRVADLEQQLEGLVQALAQRQGLLNKLKIELSTVAVEAKNEQSQLTLVDGWLADASASLRAHQVTARELDEELGPERAIHTPTTAQAEQILAVVQQARQQITAKIERQRGAARRHRDDIAKIDTRLRQIDAELQRIAAIEKSASVAAKQGRAEALKQLAVRRRGAVRQHVNEVLDELENSLLAIDEVFVAPARDAMLARLEPDASAAAKLQKAATELTPLLEALVHDLEPQLEAHAAMLEQAQREFCDVAADACRNAWL